MSTKTRTGYHANLDSLLSHPILGAEFRKTQIDSIWVGLYKEGILFRKKEESDFSIKISIEPFLDFLTGEVFINAQPDLKSVLEYFEGGDYLPISKGLSQYLANRIANLDYGILAGFIDSSEKKAIKIAGEAIAEGFLFCEKLNKTSINLFTELLKYPTKKDLEVILEVVVSLDSNFKFTLSEEKLNYFEEHCILDNWTYVKLLLVLGGRQNLSTDERLNYIIFASIMILRFDFEYKEEELDNFYFTSGILDYDLGDYNEALENFEKSLKIRLSLNGENHPKVAMNYNWIGDNYMIQKKYDKALENYMKSLNIGISIYGENNINVAMSYNNIGVYYGIKFDYDNAFKYLEKSKKILLSCYGDNHPEVAMIYNSIGGIYLFQNDYDNALKYLEKSEKIVLSCYGDNHPRVAMIYNSIGQLNLFQKKYSKAIDYFEKSKNINISIYGEIHIKVAINYFSLSSSYINSYRIIKGFKYAFKSGKILSNFDIKHWPIFVFKNPILEKFFKKPLKI